MAILQKCPFPREFWWHVGWKQVTNFQSFLTSRCIAGLMHESGQNTVFGSAVIHIVPHILESFFCVDTASGVVLIGYAELSSCQSSDLGWRCCWMEGWCCHKPVPVDVLELGRKLLGAGDSYAQGFGKTGSRCSSWYEG